MSIPFLQAHTSNFYAGRGGNSIKYIVVHYTAGNGDTAMNNAQYFHNNSGLQASAHYFVDEHSVVQSVRDTDGAWHCGGSIESDHHPLRGICTNRNSLGVEMCSDIVGGKYVITAQTVDLAVQLVRQLMAKYRIPIDRVVRHYDVTGKACPEPWVRDESLWRKFKARLTAPVEPEPKKEDDEMKIYQYVQEMPKWAQNSVTRAIKKGVVAMDKDGAVGIYECNLQPLVWLDRVGLLDK